MIKKLAIFGLLLLIIFPGKLLSQVKTPFSGDPLKYRAELTTFMGPNLNDAQKANLNSFLAKWDSAAFSDENKYRIIDVTSQFYGRAMRPVPHFNDLMAALNIFIEKKADSELLTTWLTGLSETAFNPRLNNESIDRYVKNTSLMIKDNILAETASLRWKVKNCKLEFIHDTTFLVKIKDATLTCYSQKDSTEIYNVSGTYIPELQQFHGTKGRVTWEKAGYGADEVFAELDNYVINTTRNNFTIDSARLTHKVYFKTPIKGGMNYEGGLAIEGATIKGTGSKELPARVTLFRNDTLYLKLSSSEYLFAKTGLASAETAMTLYLDKDSIFHSNLGFSYMADKRLVNLYRANNPISKSPYFDSFHDLDLYS
ncbi:MAG: hypothetical protein NT092_04885 [Bacteroidia bacterium]|nr:hypothetical protein [Bacteroidia bacterium]